MLSRNELKVNTGNITPRCIKLGFLQFHSVIDLLPANLESSQLPVFKTTTLGFPQADSAI